jgi:hypothetical protein
MKAVSSKRARIAFVAAMVLGSCALAPAPSRSLPPDARGQTWHYVVLGNSVGTWWARNYGALLETDLGVKIVYHDYYVGSQQLDHLRRTIVENEALRADIRAADVITIGCGSSETSSDAFNYSTGAYDLARLKRRAVEFKSAYDSMLRELLKVVSPSNQVIRMVDFYCPSVSKHKEGGTYTPIREHYAAVTNHIAEAGRRYGIPVARVFAAFNGADGNDDPVARGLIADDGRHPSDAGKQLIADELRKLGFSFTRR